MQQMRSRGRATVTLLATVWAVALGASLPMAGAQAVKATVVLDANASPSVSVGGEVWDTVRVSGGDTPTGVLTFKLYRVTIANDAAPCQYGEVFASTVAVNGNGSYRSAPFTVTEPTRYRWSASYSGDDRNNPAFVPCTHTNQQVVVGQTTTSTTTTSTTASTTTTTTTRPPGPPPGTLPIKVMTWNVHGAGWAGALSSVLSPAVPTAQDFVNEIRRHEVDVIGLQEVSRDQAEELAKLLSWPAPYWVGTKVNLHPERLQCELPRLGPIRTPIALPLDGVGFCQGNAIISRFPFVQDGSTYWDITPNPEWLAGERRRLLRVILRFHGREVLFYDTHLATNEAASPGEKRRQARYILERMREDRRAAQGRVMPQILLGDFNNTAWRPAIAELTKELVDAWTVGHRIALNEKACGIGVESAPASCGFTAGSPLDRRIDYVFTSRLPGSLVDGSWLGSESVIREGMTDHLPVVVKWWVPA